MNRIVNPHVKAAEIPSRFRKGIEDGALVTVTVEQEESKAEPLSRAELADLLKKARQAAKGITTEEAVARVRALRDEWDD